MKNYFLPAALLIMLFGCQQNTPKEETANASAEDEQQVELVTPEQPATEKIIIDNETMKITGKTTPAKGSSSGADGMEIRKLYREGVQKLKSEEYSEGIQAFNKVLELDPDNHHAFYNRGFAFFNLEMLNEAEADFSQAIRFNPQDSTSHLYLGMINYFRQKFEDAVTEYSEALRIAPYYADAYYNRGIAKGQLQDYDGAREDFSTALKINPNHKQAFFNRGLANFFAGDTVNACRDWREAHALGSSKAMEAINAYCK